MNVKESKVKEIKEGKKLELSLLKLNKQNSISNW